MKIKSDSPYISVNIASKAKADAKIVHYKNLYYQFDYYASVEVDSCVKKRFLYLLIQNGCFVVNI